MRQSFLNDHPIVQFGWDASSLSDFKTCPRKYYYSIVLGLRGLGSNAHLVFGSHYHAALELYDHQRAEGKDHDEAVREAIRYCLLITTTYGIPDGPVEDGGTEESVLGVDGWDCYKNAKVTASIEHRGFKFWETPFNEKNRFTLVRSIVWYLEDFKEDTAKTIILKNGKPAVELSFRIELPIKCIDGNPYLYCGHLDRLVDFQDSNYVLDRKTTKGQLNDKYFDKWALSTQMTGYLFASQIILDKPARGVIIDGAQLAVNFTRFARGITLRTKDQLDEFLEGTVWWIRQAESCALHALEEPEERQYRAFPMNEESCDKYGGCEYCKLCDKDSSVRKNFIKSEFRIELWDPLARR